MNKESILRAFNNCKLPVKFLPNNPLNILGLTHTRPHSKSAQKGFFVDVRREGKYKEVFGLFVGEDSKLHILDIDSKTSHMLIMVETGGSRKRYLLGNDRGKYFVSQLKKSKASNVKQAFSELQPDNVKKAKKKKEKVIRQGEWFFIPTPDFTVPKNCYIEYKTSIDRQNNYFWEKDTHTHIADELVRVPIEEEMPEEAIEEVGKEEVWGLVEWKTDEPKEEIYVRGKVIHREHAKVKFKEWHRAYRNLEKKHAPKIPLFDCSE